MPAPDGSQWKYLYEAPNKHHYEHKIIAVDPTNQAEVGRLSWINEGGTIADIGVRPDYRRRGVATGMWNEAYRLNDVDPDIVSPTHSSNRTDEGDAWARSVGGELPERDVD
jgi:hypothetical protein